MRLLSENGGADVGIAALTIGPAVMAEVTVGAITPLVLLANGRRRGAVLAGLRSRSPCSPNSRR